MPNHAEGGVIFAKYQYSPVLDETCAMSQRNEHKKLLESKMWKRAKRLTDNPFPTLSSRIIFHSRQHIQDRNNPWLIILSNVRMGRNYGEKKKLERRNRKSRISKSLVFFT